MFTCKKMRLYSFLLSKGFQCDHIEPSIKYPGRIVWVFKKSPELTSAVDEYYRSDYFRQHHAKKIT